MFIFIFIFYYFIFLVSLTFYAFGYCLGTLAVFLVLDCFPERKTVVITTEPAGKPQL